MFKVFQNPNLKIELVGQHGMFQEYQSTRNQAKHKNEIRKLRIYVVGSPIFNHKLSKVFSNP